MSDFNNKAWLIDARSGTHANYGELLAWLNAQPAQWRPLCQPASTTDALREIAAALAHESERDIQLLTEAALREFASERLQPFKVPRMIRFVDSIAQTRTGKVSRTGDGNLKPET